MRAFFSFGLAFAILLLAGGWLATGTLVQGGQGPGNGVQPIVAVIEGEDHGPIHTALAEAGVLAEHHEAEVDPKLTIAQRTEAVTGANAPVQSVRTQTFTAQPMTIQVPVRGRTQAKSTVAAVAETTGTVDVVHVTKGERVEAGELLCTLDQGTRAAAVAQAEASLAQAEAALAQAELNYATNADLRKRGLAATNTANEAEVALAQARAGVSQAQAGIDNAREELARTEIKAKVAGLVQDPVAVAGSMLSAGTPCATIVQLNPIVFSGSVAEGDIARAKTGLDATVTTVTGDTVEGKVSYISSVADDATRSFQAEIEIPNEDFAIRDGITARAIVNVGTVPGHLLPQSVLTLDDDGVLGVRTVEDGKVAFYPVTVVSDTRDGAWVSGLPETAEVITVGQESVTTGDQVQATPADTASAEATAS